MNEVSVAISAPFGNRYLPMIEKLGNHVCFCYGVGFSKKHKYSNEPLEKMRLTKISSRISAFIVKPIIKLFRLPDYYSYLSNVSIFDKLIYKKIAKDESHIVVINPLLCKTAEECKKKGKIVICEAGNSEPNREYKRVTDEYLKFKIKHKYIYGDKRYKERVNRSYNVADKIVTISKLSNQTYIDGGYSLDRLIFISMAGTDYPIQSFQEQDLLPKAFISVSFHNFLKGTHRLLLAWKKADIKDIPLIIAGRISDDIKEFINKYGPFNNVVFLGYVKDLVQFYKSYNAVGVLLSFSEGAVRVTPEMMSFGFPMITSLDASCDIVVDKKNGFIVNTTDEDMVVERLRWFAEDWNRVNEMKNEVLKSVSHRTIKDYSLELGEFLLSLI